MTHISQIGTVLSVDSEGYLVNEANVGLIKPPWDLLINKVRETCQQHLEDKLHSIYVRGSVGRGNAIEGISDLDCYCVYTGEITDVVWKSKFIKEARSQYPFCTKVEIVLIPYDEMLHDEKDAFERFVIATQACCVYGENLTPQFGRYKIGQEIAFHLPLIKDEINQTISIIKHSDRTENQIKRKCRWIMKRILRCGLELVMEKEGVYTRDLYPCFEIYSKYYPEQKQNMYRTLELAINPISDKETITAHLTGFGQVIIDQIDTTPVMSAD